MSRYFFALWPDKNIRKVIIDCSSQLQLTGSYTKKSNLHITLVFLGKLSQQQLPALIKQVEKIPFSSFELCLTHSGYFKNSKAAWLGLESIPDSLLQLHMQLINTAEQCNISIKSQRYKPHLTLSRKAKAMSKQQIIPIPWVIKDYALVESIDMAKGVVYQPIKFFTGC